MSAFQRRTLISGSIITCVSPAGRESRGEGGGKLTGEDDIDFAEGAGGTWEASSAGTPTAAEPLSCHFEADVNLNAEKKNHFKAKDVRSVS